ncbi:hypothetical protein GCM10011351_00600 [Paraliobacillus quinghaiensis]|uniref:HTH cro/C1-type domain-containing protein n=1 Tax=Paraliobacillus quinghaiensis TaxID=470815 RepID=A0A917TDI1_9BACI|nr:helix-turn-helix domain-containing protein [Paraliobacillus quinghaiensis]GGM18690.1 hypothetical protein GCM10011351_00600 [Paraliobacillus quinghaiensis]
MKREWLIQFRKSKQMTQEQVASAAFIDRGYYSQIENGKRNPGLNVAINIANVLHFDQLLFFQDYQNHNSYEDISQSFKHLDKGEILYLYDGLEIFLENLVIFLLKGVEQGSYCIVITDNETIDLLQKRMDTILNDRALMKKVLLISKEDIEKSNTKTIIEKYRNLKYYFCNGNVRIWLTEKPNCNNDWIDRLNHYLDTRDNKFTFSNILFVRSYNASTIPAGSYIKMMRCYPYLMTDFEIVHSPFYYPSNKSFVFPSFFIQEDM